MIKPAAKATTSGERAMLRADGDGLDGALIRVSMNCHRHPDTMFYVAQVNTGSCLSNCSVNETVCDDVVWVQGWRGWQLGTSS